MLQSPQDLVNIASAVRIAKNFALDGLRLVTPAEFDAWRIEGIAHNTADLLAKVKICQDLDEAVADCVWVVGLTARGRAAKRSVLRPREAAAELVARSASGPVAFVAGREDKGLSNEELDRCHSLVTIPVNPEYRSLNLAQAVAILSYEIWMCRERRRPAGQAAQEGGRSLHRRADGTPFRGLGARPFRRSTSSRPASPSTSCGRGAKSSTGPRSMAVKRRWSAPWGSRSSGPSSETGFRFLPAPQGER